jgi:hypothetical protein
MSYKWFEKRLLKRKLSPVGNWRKVITRGLHAYSTLRKGVRHNHSLDRTVCEFIIPKGATYYINTEYSEVVSTEMTWTGRVYSLTSKRWVKFSHKTI